MRARSTFGLLAAAALLVAAGGCASSGPYWSQEDQSAAVKQELEERVLRLEGEVAAEKERSAALQAELSRLGRELELARLRQGPPAAAPERLYAPETEPPLEPDTAPEAEPGARREIEQSDLELPDEPTPPGIREPPASTGVAEAAPAAETATEGLYERSLELLEQGLSAEAEAGFAQFLAANPDSDLADNAQFWLAESALRRTDVASALAGFRAVVERYPEGNKVPDALLKVGFCLGEMGEPESAAVVYTELLERFPETPAADAARQRLGLR